MTLAKCGSNLPPIFEYACARRRKFKLLTDMRASCWTKWGSACLGAEPHNLNSLRQQVVRRLSTAYLAR